PVPRVGEVYHQVGVKFGSKKSVEEVTAAFKLAFAATESQPDASLNPHSDNPHSDPWWTSEAEEFRRWQTIVGMVLDDVADPQLCFRELHDHFARAASWRIFPEVSPTLAALRKRGFRVVLASNFDDRLHSVCRGSQDLQFLDACFISSELGVRKPSLGFYRRMLEQLNLPPHQLLMIGDDLQNDIHPPRQLGVPSLWLNRTLTAGHLPSIKSLSDLLPLLPS
ncbi:MAG: HAD-IIIA family hydrolase, partial [Planctomycetaceae bacterium]|nr:HAD-IIIA family hydrolase [Planctomycetaceae bacterium]